jgi:nucleotide-binding universal stress UspA family protein
MTGETPKIVVAYDGSDPGRRALERGAGLADGASVTVVSVAHLLRPVGRGPGPEPIDPDEVARRDRALEEAKSRLAEKGIEARLVPGIGDPATVLVEEAREWGADLIVVGTRGLNLGERIMLGSVSTKVVHHAPCDVLVVR